MAAVVHSSGLRRGVVLLAFLLTLSWFVFTLVFLVESYSASSLSQHGAVAPLFTCVVGVLLLLTTALFLSAPERILVLLDATHRGVTAVFFVTSFYVFTLLTAFLWRLSSAHHEESARQHYNLVLLALFTTGLMTLLSILATAIFSGMLIAPQRRQRRRVILPPITSTASRRAVKPVPPPPLTVAYLLSTTRAVTTPAMQQQQQLIDEADDVKAHYLVVPHTELRRSDGIVLIVLTYLSEIFLFIMGLLAMLESQRVHVLAQLWLYTLFYGFLGGLLLVAQILALLSYARRYPELTFRHTLPLNLNLVTSVTVWLYSLVVLSLWLSSYAPPCCTGDVHASPRQEPAWTLYNNAVTLVGALSVLTVATFVPAATAHLYPERREPYSIDVSSSSSSRR